MADCQSHESNIENIFESNMENIFSHDKISWMCLYTHKPAFINVTAQTPRIWIPPNVLPGYYDYMSRINTQATADGEDFSFEIYEKLMWQFTR